MALCVLAAMGISIPSAWAKEESREPTFTWGPYGSPGEFDSAEEVLEAINQDEAAKYDACVATECESCTKHEYYPPMVPSWLASKYNGHWMFVSNSDATRTSYNTACTINGTYHPPVGPTVQPNALARVSIDGDLYCPDGYGPATKSLGTEEVNGVSYPVYETACIKRVPDPCCNPKDRQFGNPIDAVGGAKVESQVDYASADGLLQVQRSYSSRTGRWNWGVGASIADFTGRGQLPVQSDLIAYVKLVPPGIYESGSAPPAVPTPRKFRLRIDPRVTNQLQTWVIHANGGSTAFAESAGVFSTTAPNKPQLTLIPGPGGTQRWLYRAPGRGFQVFSMSGDLLSEVSADGKTLSYAYSANSVTVTASPGGRQLTYSRSTTDLPPGYYDSVALPDGNQIQYQIDDVGMVTRVTFADATQKTYLYNEPAHSAVGVNSQPPNRLTGVLDEGNVRYGTYKYDADGPISTELGVGVNKYTFDLPGIGNTVGLSRVTNTQGAETRIDWNSGPDGEYRITTVTQPAGAGSASSTTTTTYDASGNVASRKDYKNNKTCFKNDATRGVEIVRVEGIANNGQCPADPATYTIPTNTRQRKISTQYHPDWSFATARAEPNKLTRWIYNGQPDPSAGGATAQCAPTGATLPDGNPIAVVCKRIEQATTDDTGTSGFSAAIAGTPRIWTYTYNDYGQALNANGPRIDVADVTTYTYYTCTTGYQCGQVATLTNALNDTTTYNSYNAHGQPLTITDANGATTTLTYDLRQRLTSRTIAGEQTSFDYWPTGLLKKQTLPDGTYLEYTYDAAHRLTDLNDSEGNRIHYVLDNGGNRTGEEVYDQFNVLAKTRTRAFDALNRISQDIGAANTAAVTTSYTYDNNGNQKGINAPLSRNTAQTYDELDRLSQVTDSASGLTKYGYNALDQLTSVIDPNNLTTSYTYNGLGDLLTQVSPDTGTTTQTYDTAGNLATRIDARGSSTALGTYSYDALNRPTQIVYPDQTLTYGYDTCPNGKGRLCAMTDASGSTSYEYDAQGRVTRKVSAITLGPGWGTQTREVRYAYTNGRLTQLTMPEGHRVNYSYDTVGRVSAMSVDVAFNGSVYASHPLLSNVLYDPFGGVRGWTWANGTLAVREYDQDGRTTVIDSAGLSTRTYDDASRITAITTDGSTPAWSYGYDALDRLTSAARTGLSRTYGYDANGNRLSLAGTESATFAYSSPLTSNRLASVSGSLTRSYSYDAAGNVTNDGLMSYGYNGAGRMTSAGSSLIFSHNGLGQRAMKSFSPGIESTYRYDEAGHVLEKCVTSVGNQCNPVYSQHYLWLGDIPVAAIMATVGYTEDGDFGGYVIEPFNIHTDHLNTPRRLTRADATDQLIWRWDSDPFGIGVADGHVAGGFHYYEFDLRFPGQVYDWETGLSYNYFRDYEPQVGRYVESDPIGLAGGLNTYGYSNGSPIMSSDPTGTEAVSEMYRRDWSNPATDGIGQTNCARAAFLRNYMIMREWKLSDKYFHCKANCEAARCGDKGYDEACRLSDQRERYGQRKDPPDPILDSLADQDANRHGRWGSVIQPNQTCQVVCSRYRPRGLPAQF